MALHARVTGGRVLLSHAVSAAAGISVAEAKNLIHLGAVYHLDNNKTSQSLVPDGLERTLIDKNVNDHDVLRFYPSPRRYPFASDIEWSDRILVETDDFLVIDKPAGLPCHPTVDNFRENILVSLEQSKASTSLVCDTLNFYLPHRLDVDTSGILFVAKNKDTVKWVNRAIKLKRTRKVYRALLAYNRDPSTMEFLSKGLVLSGYVEKSSYSPKKYVWTIPTEEDAVEYQDASLRIIEVKPPQTRTRSQWLRLAETAFAVGSTAKLSLALKQWCSTSNATDSSVTSSDVHRTEDPSRLDSKTTFQEVTVQLITGRTHQIRGQLQALSRHPLISDGSTNNSDVHIAGDNVYRGCTSLLDEQYISSNLALQASSLQIEKPANKNSVKTNLNFEIPSTWWEKIYDIHT